MTFSLIFVNLANELVLLEKLAMDEAISKAGIRSASMPITESLNKRLEAWAKVAKPGDIYKLKKVILVCEGENHEKK